MHATEANLFSPLKRYSVQRLGKKVTFVCHIFIVPKNVNSVFFFLTVCVINILDAVRFMTSAMIKPWSRAAITRNGRRIPDLDALVVVRIPLVAWTTMWHEISRDLIFDNFTGVFTIRINKPV